MATNESQWSVTELPQFRRLCDFMEEVMDHALQQEDSELMQLCETLADDLREMKRVA